MIKKLVVLATMFMCTIGVGAQQEIEIVAGETSAAMVTGMRWITHGPMR